MISKEVREYLESLSSGFSDVANSVDLIVKYKVDIFAKDLEIEYLQAEIAQLKQDNLDLMTQVNQLEGGYDL